MWTLLLIVDSCVRTLFCLLPHTFFTFKVYLNRKYCSPSSEAALTGVICMYDSQRIQWFKIPVDSTRGDTELRRL